MGWGESKAGERRNGAGNDEGNSYGDVKCLVNEYLLGHLYQWLRERTLIKQVLLGSSLSIT